jgi:hypothetical protein
MLIGLVVGIVVGAVLVMLIARAAVLAALRRMF